MNLFTCPHTGIPCLYAACSESQCSQVKAIVSIEKSISKLNTLARQRRQLSTRLEGRIVALKARQR